MTEPRETTAKQLRADVRPLLHVVWEAWEASLPPQAKTTWRHGCAYIRESSIKSLASNAPDIQLRNTLNHLASKGVYVPWEGVFFDQASGTDVVLRTDFQRLFELALAGGFQVIGVFVAERMFRNLEQASRYKREFRLHGIELEYLGKFEGDPRNPASWQLEVMQDMNAEYQARTTGYYVGTHIEALTRDGYPTGWLPEAYEVAERAPSFMGHRGSAISWRFVQPLASVISEGREHYLAGASFVDLARWSDTTVLGGSTPRGSRMTSYWWRYTLQNPKFAGYQMPTSYQGFRPGKESPKRPRRRKTSELVACRLPALWSLEDYRAIIAEGDRRVRGVKVRRSYRSYLLSGITVDERCGHGMAIYTRHDNGRFSMVCRQLGTQGRDHPCIRADVAERELDDLLARISFEDEVLIGQVDAEVEKLARQESVAIATFRTNPAIATIRRAIVDLRSAGIEDASLAQRVQALEAADEDRRYRLAVPMVEYRKATLKLRDWAEVWRGTDTTLKNRLLREAGVTVVIAQDHDDQPGPAHVVSIAAENPVFALALATMLGAGPGHLSDDRGADHQMSPIFVLLSDLAEEAARQVGMIVADEHGVPVLRPFIPVSRPKGRSRTAPLIPETEWRPLRQLPIDDPNRLFSIPEAALATGVRAKYINFLARDGRIMLMRVGYGHGRLLVPQAQIGLIRQLWAGRRIRSRRRLDPAA